MTDPTMNPTSNGQAEPMTDAPGTGAGGEDATAQETEAREAVDELKSALAQALGAATKLGQVLQSKVRTEWKSNRPEFESVLSEVQRGIETAAHKASTALDSLGKRIEKTEGAEGEQAPGAGGGAAAASAEQPTEPVDRPPSNQPPV